MTRRHKQIRPGPVHLVSDANAYHSIRCRRGHCGDRDVKVAQKGGGGSGKRTAEPRRQALVT